MAVNLSPIGGVAAQFFDNSGNILSGGKIFTYAAGTTTPQATYTSSNGLTAHSNPIILDAAGRVPNGEIWLTDGLQYKFLIKTSTDVQIGSYDNIVGINSNFVNYTSSQEIQTATAGQTVFTLTTMQYQPGTNSLSVFVDGVNQYGPGALYAYVETSSTVVTFTSGLHVGADVKFTTTAINSSAATDAEQVGYIPPFTGSVPTNVELKLAQTVSVTDFGAVGNGLTDDTAAIQAAIDALATSGGGTLTFEPKTYIVKNTSGLGCLIAKSNVTLSGAGAPTVIKLGAAAGNCALLYSASAVSNITIDGVVFDGNSGVITAYDTYGIWLENVTRLTINNCVFQNLRLDGMLLGQTALAKQVTVENSIFKNIGVAGFGANGIRVYYSQGLLINANYFYDFIVSPIDTNPTPGGNLETNIIVTNNYIKNGAGWLPGYSSISLLADRILCQGNTVIGGGNIVVHDYAGSGQTTRDYRVIGNSLTNTVSGITVNQGENSDIVVTSNVIRGFNQFGINVYNPNIPATATTNPVIVSNNIIEDTNTNVTYTTTNQPVCILIFNANNVLCSANQCIKPRFAGIWAASSSNVTISDNFIINQAGYAPSDLLTFNGGGILVSPGGYSAPFDVDNVIINGNFVYNYLTTLSASPSSNFRTGGIVAYNDTSGAKTVSNIVITNNTVNQGYGIGVQTYTLASCYINGNSIFNASSGRLVDTSSVQRVSNPSVGSYTAAPTTGTWVRGDIVYNSAPASLGYVGWVCTASGTPGTWATFGLIS